MDGSRFGRTIGGRGREMEVVRVGGRVTSSSVQLRQSKLSGMREFLAGLGPSLVGAVRPELKDTRSYHQRRSTSVSVQAAAIPPGHSS